MNVQVAIEFGSASRPAESSVEAGAEGDGNEAAGFGDVLCEAQSQGSEGPPESKQHGAVAPDSSGRDPDGEGAALVASGQAAVVQRAQLAPAGGAPSGGSGASMLPLEASRVPQPPAQQAAASLLDAGRAGSPLPASLATPDAGGGEGLQVGGARTLDTTPWFAVRSSAPGARGQALAQALQPALKETTILATRADQAPQRSSGVATTVLGSFSEVQRMVDGTVEVRAPELVARAVTHNAAKGAMLQGQRAGINLPQAVMEAASSNPADAPMADPEAGDTRPAASLAPRPPADARPAVPAPGAAAPASPLVLDAPMAADIVPGTTPADGVASLARGAAGAAAAATDAALAAGRPTEAQLGQVAVPDADHMELKVSDGDRSFRLSVAREADGLNVELKAPREIVADLRALEPDVEAALAEDGYDLASFDAHAEDSQSEAAGQGADDTATDTDQRGDDTPGASGPPVAPAGQGRIINRLA